MKKIRLISLYILNVYEYLIMKIGVTDNKLYKINLSYQDIELWKYKDLEHVATGQDFHPTQHKSCCFV